MTVFWRRPAIEFRRARQVAEVLIRNGLGLVAEQTGLARFARRGQAVDAAAARLTLSQRLRKTLEDLGPAYIKLGQILSTRPDILPAEYIVELTHLLDSAQPARGEEIRRVIERELNVPLDTLYSWFDEEPLATASIGQVHRARLLDGTNVVVKVQRPGVEETIEADVSLLQTQARYLQRHSETFARYHVQDLADEFAQALHDELDYTLEGHNADRLRSGSNDERVIFPIVYWPLTTRRVITMQELPGTKLADTEKLKACGYDLRSIADVVSEIYLKQVFELGIFHADPHPANILVHEDKIGLVDFGSVGYLTPQIREELSALLFALVRQDTTAMVDIINRMGIIDTSTRTERLQADIQRLLPRYYGSAIEGFPMAQFLNDFMNVTFKHHVRLPADFILLVRSLLVLEGVVVNLDPSYNLALHIEPFARRMMREQFSATRNLAEAAQTWQELARLLRALPKRTDVLSTRLERGDLTLGLELRQMDKTMRKLDTIANRLSFSLIVAALIIGSALATLSGDGSGLTFTIPFTKIAVPLAQLGFIAASVSGALLIISILRSRGL